MYYSDPAVTQQIVEHVSRLIYDPEYRGAIQRNARETVRTRFTVEHWNQGLRTVFDNALATS